MSMDSYMLPTGNEVNYNKNLYILGTSNNGPVLEPVLARSVTYVKNIFGNEGSLLKAFNEAFQVANDKINIYLVRITGSCSEFALRSFDHGEIIKLKSLYGGKMYNDIKVYIYEDSIEIFNPYDLGGECFVFCFDEYKTIGKLVNAINDKSKEGLYVTAVTEFQFEDVSFIPEYYIGVNGTETQLLFEYGEDGLIFSKNELHEYLGIAYNILEGQPIDVICICDACFNDTLSVSYYGDNSLYGTTYYTANRDYLTLPHENIKNRTATFHGQAIKFCSNQMNHSIVTHSVMQFCPIDDMNFIRNDNEHINKIVSASCFTDRFDLSVKSDTSVNDNGKFISVMFSEFEYKDINNKSYYNNGFIGYGATIATGLTTKSLTNKVIPNIPSLRYYLEDKDSELLSKIGIVTCRKSILKNGIVVCNAVTAELASSPYHNVSNMLMIQTVIKYFKNLMDYFIGANIAELRKSHAVEKMIESLINDLKEKDMIKNIEYSFNLSLSGVALLELNILAIYAIEYVTASGSFKL